MGSKVVSRSALDKSDLAKYPFIPEAAEYVKKLGIQIDDLTSLEYRSILDRAENRVQEAILVRTISQQSPKDDIEIPSFPIAVMIVAALADSFIKKRYALAEAKRVSDILKEEEREKIVEIAENFKWKIKPATGLIGARNYDFMLYFTDFLRNSADFLSRDKKWKLVNRLVSSGEVYLTKSEISRLLEEEVRRYVEAKVNIEIRQLPENIMSRVNRLKQLFQEKKAKIRIEDIPKRVVIPAFPPCIRNVYDTIASGRQVSHIGRFALTSFLINIGMTVENVMDLFRTLSDFDEGMSRYQVEHIAGVRGSRTKYMPPRCDTLRTHGLCTSTEELCKRIRHPLVYYRKRLGMMKNLHGKD